MIILNDKEMLTGPDQYERALAELRRSERNHTIFATVLFFGMMALTAVFAIHRYCA